MINTMNQSNSAMFDTLLKQEGKDIEIVSYGISDGYVPNWQEVQALIEYLANFYDENGTDFIIKEVEDGLILEDQSPRGIKLQDLVVGNSSSREFSYKIGTHGEGFKLASLVLVRNHKRVMIETVGVTILFFLENDKKLNSTVLKSKIIPNNRKTGSRVFLETDILPQVKERFLFLNDKIEKLNDFLYANHDEESKNYIYVNTLASQEINASFSYSLLVKQVVNRDRNMLEIPYDDMLVQIFSLQDKTIIRKWLATMTNWSFRNSFEYDLITQYMNHRQRKVLKSLDLSLFVEVAKEMKLQYIGSSKISVQRKKAFRLAHPEKHLIVTEDYSIRQFCEKILGIPTDNSGLHYGFKNEDIYFLPIFTDDFHYQPSDEAELIEHFRSHLHDSKILKKVTCKDSTIHFEMISKAKDKLDYLNGRTSLKNTHIRSAFRDIYHLLSIESSSISFANFDVGVRNDLDVPFITMKELPQSFNITVKDKEVLNTLLQNVHFLDAKEISPNSIFSLKNGETYLIDTNYNLYSSINACFSYVMKDDKDMNALSNSKVMNAFLQKIKENPLRDDLYEFDFIRSIIQSPSYRFYGYEKDNLKTTLHSQFKKVFGTKTVISLSAEDDRKAKYNSYQVLKVSPVLENYFVFLDILLSKDVRGVSLGEPEHIERPEIGSKTKDIEGEYKQIFTACYTLYESLVHLYNSTKDISPTERKHDFIKALLPYVHPSNRLIKIDGKIALNNSNYKSIINEYCFKLFERTFFVTKIDDDGALGLARKDSIVLLAQHFSLGTFMHEYVHFATNLIDIDENFEKMLSLANVISYRFKNPSNDDVQNFFSEYKKWLGVS